MRTIFLDRDGVINENRADHVKSWAEFQFVPGALDALRLLTQHRFQIFVVTNQAGVNQGRLSHHELQTIHGRMQQAASAHGASVRDVRYCPHRSDEACGCRKPKPGMLLSLAREWGVNLSQAYLIGDALTDLQAGQAAGCHTVMVLTGRGAEQVSRLPSMQLRPAPVLANLWAAVHWVLDAEGLTAREPAYLLARPALG